MGWSLTAPEETKAGQDIVHVRAGLNWRPRLNFAFAIWQLAQESFPSLKVKPPRQWL